MVAKFALNPTQKRIIILLKVGVIPHKTGMILFSYLSLAFDWIANIPYVYGVAKGTIRTHPITWLLWTLLTFVIAAIQYDEGAGGGGWLAISATCFNFIVTIFAVWRGGIGFVDKKDYAVLAVCILCFPLYFYFNQSLWAALIITIVDCVSFIPMIRKSLKDPYGESLRFQWLAAAAYGCSLLALENHTVPICLFPVAMVIMHGMTGTVIMIFRKKIPSITT